MPLCDFSMPGATTGRDTEVKSNFYCYHTSYSLGAVSAYAGLFKSPRAIRRINYVSINVVYVERGNFKYFLILCLEGAV